MSALDWQTRYFNDLSLNDLYDILALRNQVFIVEQDCAYQDIDGLDDNGIHLFTRDQAGLIAYARIIPPDDKGTASIGRLIIAPAHRSKGIGHDLMAMAKTAIVNHFGECTIRISAQSHLANFYHQHGFETIGDDYLLDGIPHRDMQLTKQNQ